MPRGFTLVELVVSLALVSITMVAIGSTILMATHALPRQDDPVLGTLNAARVTEQLSTELLTAVYITEWSAHSVGFIVPDRDGDGSMESIRYAWSGEAGEPLMRQYNAEPAAPVLASAEDFSLAFTTLSVPETYPGPMIESDEQVISSKATSTAAKEFSIENQLGLSQRFTPTFPADVTAWSPTRVLIKARDDGGHDDVTYVQLRSADGSGAPTDQVFVEQTLDEKTLDSDFRWRTVWFDTVVNLAPGDPTCIVLTHPPSDNSSARVELDFDGGDDMRVTGDSGATWTVRTDSTLLHYVYGVAKSPGPDQTITHTLATAVHITAQAAADVRAVTTAQGLVNKPMFVTVMAELDFTNDPLTIDHKGDGPDWTAPEANVSADNLINGAWHAPAGYAPNRAMLRTQSTIALTGPMIIDARYHAASVGGTGAVVQFDIGQQVVRIIIRRDDPDAQQLCVYHTSSTNVETQVATLALDGTPATVRAIVNQQTGSVSVEVDGTHLITITAGGGSGSTTSTAVRIYADGAAGAFDHVRVRALPSITQAAEASQP